MLHLLIARDPVRRTVILADPATEDPGPIVTALAHQLGDAHALIFPQPDETTRRHPTPPSLVRGRHAALWHALDAAERDRVLLAAGPTAAYLAPLEPSSRALVALQDPRTAPAGPGGTWRSVLGPFAELDELPEAPEESEDRDRWRERIVEATGPLRLVRADDPGAVVVEVAAALGLNPQRAERAGRAATPAAANGGPARRRQIHWLEEILYDLAEPPRLPPRKRRRARPAAE